MTDDLTAAVERLRDYVDGDGFALRRADVAAVLAALESAQQAQRFAGKILAAYADNWDTDFDGATLEDWADECGLMEWIVPAPDGSDRCRNCEGDPCEQCHRYTDAAQAAIDAAMGGDNA